MLFYGRATLPSISEKQNCRHTTKTDVELLKLDVLHAYR